MSPALIQSGRMVTLSDLRAAETDMRNLLDAADLAQPDEVEFREASVVLLWHHRKLVVVIDVTDDCLTRLRGNDRGSLAASPSDQGHDASEATNREGP